MTIQALVPAIIPDAHSRLAISLLLSEMYGPTTVEIIPCGQGCYRWRVNGDILLTFDGSFQGIAVQRIAVRLRELLSAQSYDQRQPLAPADTAAWHDATAL